MGYIIEIEGLKIEIENELPKEGEMYVALAKRNTDLHLLTAKEIDMENRWIVPYEKAYLFNLSECKRVIRMVEE